jgi:hypothetical protein
MTAVFSSTSQMMRQVIYALVLGSCLPKIMAKLTPTTTIHQGAILGIEIANKIAVKIADPSAIAGLIGCFLGTLVSFTNKTDCHDRTEILLKVVLNTMSSPPHPPPHHYKPAG